MTHHQSTSTMPSEDSSATTSLDEPPDRSALPRPITMQSINNVPVALRSLSSSLADCSTSPTVPYSPYMADSTGGSASDYEHECDSPSSLSSWNSWAGSRRGDLADVEDLELDGGLNLAEPELETVSELDEESSGFFSGSDRLGLDSDDDVTRNIQFDKGDLNGTRRKNFRAGGQFNDVSQNHHVHHASNQHQYHHQQYQPTTSHYSHPPPSFPHFSPRAGGHGLSHASRYSLRAPPNLAARRRKGRIAELAEEGGGDGINTTVMPPTSQHRKDGSDQTRMERSEDMAPSSQTETETDNNDNRDDLVSPSTPTMHSMSHGWGEFEFVGPPALPVRCVSPSETVPVVPSPLSVCLSAEEQNIMEEKAGNSIKNEGNSSTGDHQQGDVTARPGSPPSPTTSGKSIESFPATVSTPSTSPPSSPLLTRKGSRTRRSSSPGKTALRPCFRRRASAQVGSKKVESSSECESNSESRGRGKVRFSTAPPVEVRTHSPVEYDRKACPISNRLSPSDVEELREMKMEMGLLEAKMAAMAACKPEVNTEDEESESEASSNRLVVPTLPYTPINPDDVRQEPERKRADSISSSSPTKFCKIRFYGRDTSISPADHLRIEREKERDRACRMAGIGTGIGFRYSGGGTTPRQLHHGGSKTPGACNSASIISRFGLSKPPPPLPGCTSPTRPHYEGGTSLHRPSSAPPTRSQSSQGMPSLEDMLDAREEVTRGRSLNKGAFIRDSNDSASTDGTITGSTSRSTSVSIPEVIHTSPSPETSPERHSNSHSRSPPKEEEKMSRPGILPHQPPQQLHHIDTFTQSQLKKHQPYYSPTVRRQHSMSGSVQASPSPPSSTHSIPTNHSSPCGYDSPASEFYESGSEYDLIG